MIGVVCRRGQEPWVKEFFELFKTPWQFCARGRKYPVVLSTAGCPDDLNTQLLILYGSDASRPCVGEAPAPGTVKVVRAGYDLFDEVEYMLTRGQPPSNSAIPTLDLYIATLRNWILDAGISLIEIPPVPGGYDFIACLTHDVDFIRISDHKLDHTLLGFLRRASIGSLRKFARGEMSWCEFLENVKAALLLPAVHVGLANDFWLADFDRFIDLERGLNATYFFIPFKSKAGDKPQGPNWNRRAAAYDVAAEDGLLKKLQLAGHEIGVHGIDAWHDAKKGREEYRRVAAAAGRTNLGVRMHWLCFDECSPRRLEEAGFRYDSTMGYNETVGYRAGTTQVFKPQDASTLLELPLHIQDTALFYEGHLNLAKSRAWNVCEPLITNAKTYGGVVTLLWHTRSLAPERQWREFYVRLLENIKAYSVWFATAGQVVEWFRKRRSFSFQEMKLRDEDSYDPTPNLVLRVHSPSRSFTDVECTEEPLAEIVT